MTIASGLAKPSVRSLSPNVRDSSRVLGKRGASPAARSCWMRSIMTTSTPSSPSSSRVTTRTRSRVTSPPICSMPRGISVSGATRRTRAPSLARHRMLERATREWAMSPTIATSRPAIERGPPAVAAVPLARRMVAASSSAWVGCSCWPSPALTTAQRTWLCSIAAAPPNEWRTTITSGCIASRLSAVSSSVSPLLIDEPELEMLIASADSRLAAISNEVRVRVEFSRNRLITVRPRSEVSFLTGSLASAQ
jgi:hypothetical protein